METKIEKDLKQMSYSELEKEVLYIDNVLRDSMFGKKKISLNKERELITKSHDIKCEMDRRWNTGEMKTKVIH